MNNGPLRLFVGAVCVIYGCCVVVDFGDWIINSEAGSENVPHAVAPYLNGRQSRIVVVLGFWRTQFSYLLVTLVFTSYYFRINRMLRLEHLVQRTDQHFCATIPKTISRALISSTGRRQMVTCIVGIMACLSTLRLVSYIEGTISDSSFWDPIAYFAWRIPTGINFLVLLTLLVIGELLLLPLYLRVCFIIFNVAKLIELYNSVIEDVLLGHSRAKGTSLMASWDAKFGGRFQCLCRLENMIAEVIFRTDKAFRLILGMYLLGNGLQLSSMIAQIFVSSNFVTWRDYCMYAASSTQPLMAMVGVVFFSSTIYEERMTSVALWRRLVAARNEEKQREPFMNDYVDNGERIQLLLLLHTTSHRKQGVTLSGTSYITKSLGATILIGYVGFICFLIERAEHFDADKSREMLLNQWLTGNVSFLYPLKM